MSDELKALLLPAQPSSPSWSSSSSSFRSSCLRMDGRFTTSPRGPPGGRPSGPTPPWERENLARSQKSVKEVNKIAMEINIRSISTQLEIIYLQNLPRGLVWGWVPVRSLWTIGGWKGQVWWIHLEIKMQIKQKGYECTEQMNRSKF